ncbi:retrotransposon protein, putative, ty1-copia subclass [Tanacetum coccineum]
MHVIEQPLTPAPEPVSEPNVVAEWSFDLCLKNKLEWRNLMLANRMRENQLAHMSLDEELCETGINPIRNCLMQKAIKVKGKGKDKKVYIPKPKNPKPTAMEHQAKDDTCHFCKEVGHCKRNCPAYLAELIKKKKQI